MSEYKFKLTDISKGLSMNDIERACFTLFTTPINVPSDRPEIMTLEEFILKEDKWE